MQACSDPGFLSCVGCPSPFYNRFSSPRFCPSFCADFYLAVLLWEVLTNSSKLDCVPFLQVHIGLCATSLTSVWASCLCKDLFNFFASDTYSPYPEPGTVPNTEQAFDKDSRNEIQGGMVCFSMWTKTVKTWSLFGISVISSIHLFNESLSSVCLVPSTMLWALHCMFLSLQWPFHLVSFWMSASDILTFIITITMKGGPLSHILQMSKVSFMEAPSLLKV